MTRTRAVTTVLALAAAALVVVAAAAASGVDPASYSTTLAPGGSTTITKTVHTPAIPPQPDVYFLTDSTGSMGGAISNVQTNAASIMSTVAGSATNPMFGAGDYKDFQRPQTDPYVFRNDAAIGSASSAQTGINTWSAGGGDDGPEGFLYALHEIATDPSIGWRTGSSRILVWFGDAPGHDPICSAMSGLGFDLTTGSVAAELAAANIKVIAISLNTGGYAAGLNDNSTLFEYNYDGVCGAPSVVTNEAQTIAAATGGLNLFAASPSDVSNQILAGLTNLPATVTPNAPSCDAGVSVSLSPASVTVTSGQDATFSETISVDSGAVGGDHTCTQGFSINGVDAGSDFVQTVTVTVPSPDLSLTKTGPALVQVGDDVTYTLTATNNGPSAATGVAISDPVPANSTFVSADAGCTLSAGTVTCTIGNLAAGASQTFHVTVQAGTGSSITNTASVGGDQTDPSPGNNSASTTAAVNHPPVCSAATAGPDLWPPNHKLSDPRSITGVTDQDGDPVSVTVTSIWQDEPTNGLGDGDTGPNDAVILGANSFQVRAERSGNLNGRVYYVNFTASDGRGGSCSGTATIAVPHDQAHAAVGDGQLYKSIP